MALGRILILGASGFIGGTLYKEFCNYADTYGTYHTGRIYSANKHFFRYDMNSEDVFSLLVRVRPEIIISALRGDFDAQLEAHHQMIEYCLATGARLVFLSSANVFDAFSNYPSYEHDKTLSESIYGKLKIQTENAIMRHLPEKQYVIARLPMVFGMHSPRVKELRFSFENKTAYEVFPNLVMNVTDADKLSRQLHYMINRKRKGIFHLGSTDLVHHDEFITELCRKLGLLPLLFKNVYTSNFDRYLAVLPRDNKLPAHLLFGYQDILNELHA